MTNLDSRRSAHPRGVTVVVLAGCVVPNYVTNSMAGPKWRVSTKRIFFGQEGFI